MGVDLNPSGGLHSSEGGFISINVAIREMSATETSVPLSLLNMDQV